MESEGISGETLVPETFIQLTIHKKQSMNMNLAYQNKNFIQIYSNEQNNVLMIVHLMMKKCYNFIQLLFPIFSLMDAKDYQSFYHIS